jgi:hypothetical protein
MAVFSAALLAGMLFLLIIAAGLLVVGFINIRSGLRSLSSATLPGQNTLWHRQPAILFGCNNLLFALLLVWGAGLFLFVDHTVRFVLLGLIVLTFLFSIVLVVRTITHASLTAKDLRARR